MDKFMNALKDLSQEFTKSEKQIEEKEKDKDILQIDNTYDHREYYPKDKSSDYCLGNNFTRMGKKIKE